MDFQIDTDPRCIINTSGSTGTPKGVFLYHRSFFEFTEVSIENVKLLTHEVIGSLSPLVFDIWGFELCLLMSQGSTLLFMPEQLSAFPIKKLELLKLHQVSSIFLGTYHHGKHCKYELVRVCFTPRFNNSMVRR